MDKKILDTLKKYNISENKSYSEISELLSISLDELLEKQNVTRDESLNEEIDELQETIDLVEKEAKNASTYLTELDDEEIAKQDTKSSQKNIAGLKGAAPSSSNAKKLSSTANLTGVAPNGGQQSQTPQSQQSGAAGAPQTPTGLKPVNDPLWFSSTDPTIHNLFAQIEGELKYGQWDSAIRMADSIFRFDPNNPGAYMAKALASFRVGQFADLQYFNGSMEKNVDFKRARDYGSQAQKDAIDMIHYNRQMNREYDQAMDLVNSNTYEGYKKAIDMFGKMNNYRDSAKQKKYCEDNLENVRLREIEEKKKAELSNRLAGVEKDMTLLEGARNNKNFPRLLQKCIKDLDSIEEDMKSNSIVDTKLSGDIDRLREMGSDYKSVAAKLKTEKLLVNIVGIILLVILVRLGDVPFTGASLAIYERDMDCIFPWSVSSNNIKSKLPVPVFATAVSYYGMSGDIENNSKILKTINIYNLKGDIKLATDRLKELSIRGWQYDEDCITPGAQDVYISDADIKSLTIPEAQKVTISCSDMESLAIEGAKKVNISEVKLRKLTIPEGAESVSLQDCDIYDLELPESLVSLELNNVRGLDTLVLDEKYQNLSSVSINRDCSFTTISIMNGNSTNITIRGVENLQILNLGEGVQTLTCDYCTSLVGFNIPQSMSELRLSTCNALTGLSIDNSMDTLTVEGCEQLENIYINEYISHVIIRYNNILTGLALPEDFTSMELDIYSNEMLPGYE